MRAIFNRDKNLHWNLLFNVFMEKYWDNRFRSIPIFLKFLPEEYALFQYTPEGINDIIIAKNVDSLKNREIFGVLLHEMCHHAVFEMFGGDVPEHGQEWEAEMKRIGFPEPIDYTSGVEFFMSDSKEEDLDSVMNSFTVKLASYIEENAHE